MMTLPEKDLVAPHKSYNLNVTKDLVPMHIFSETTQGKDTIVLQGGAWNVDDLA